ncbi:Na/H antiporter-like protein [Strigomonas culicis]|uniref:Na/H antiporter-like protein n=1 Tax=Strigomonas culicis TaxID=28005 RepID=S9TPR2_9TRYP|nr:Na/H antiporter-like protein [Strigomonas culicis]|eukprot:EPY18629.1 Na/H antiporter-like protein [Strigomonas culicis]
MGPPCKWMVACRRVICPALWGVVAVVACGALPATATVTDRGGNSSVLAAAVSETTESTSSGEALTSLSLGILFLCMLIFLGGTFFMTLKDRIPLPYTVILFLYGILMGELALLVDKDVAKALGSIPPDLLFYIFLPVLIFEGSYAINIHALRRVLWQTVILATVGIVINTVLLALIVKLLFSTFSWYAALLLGSLLSATDPVAVVSLLKNLQVEKSITAIVDGEAVMNDGTAIIIFTLLLPAASVGYLADPAWLIVLQCIRLSVIPIFLGPVFGFLQSFWLRRAKEPLTRACITVSVTYVSYYIASTLIGTSGVLTLFFEGVFLSYYYPSMFPGIEGNLIYSTWEFLVHLGNTLLFSLVGIILVADVIPTLTINDVGLILGLYVTMIAARLVMLEALLPLLNLFPYKLDQKKVLLLVHAGLRGGVAATLALAVYQENLKEGITILKMTCGVVLLTLLVNATTAEHVVKFLRFNSRERFRFLRMQYAMSNLAHSQAAQLDRLKRDTKYRNANWRAVEKYLKVHMKNPFAGSIELPDEDERALNRVLTAAFKTSLWRQMDGQVISETIIIEIGRMLAKNMESGELFLVRDMQRYHKIFKGPPLFRRKKKRANPARNYLDAAPRRAEGKDDLAACGQPTADDTSTDTAREGRRSTPLPVRSSATATPLPMMPLSRPRTGGGGSSAGRRSPAAGTLDSACSSQLPEAHELEEMRRENANIGLSVTRFQNDHALSIPMDLVSPSVGEALLDLTPGPPEAAPDEGRTNQEAVEALTERLLPTWVMLAERFFCGKGYFTSAHRRAQENAFMTLLALAKCFSSLLKIKYKYTHNEQEARRIDHWLQRQLADVNTAIRFFYSNFPTATNNVASARAVISVVNALAETVEELHHEHGFGRHVTGVLEGLIDNVRSHIPQQWRSDTESKDEDLVLRAVATSALGRGLRDQEVQAIATMGLVRTFAEDDVITLPDNAFLIVVFGSLRAVHGPWTSIADHEATESFGDTVGLNSFLITPKMCEDRQRRWRVLSTEATALLISFNSIRPFLMERSLRSVRALWRAVAAEVLVPFLVDIFVQTEDGEEEYRKRLVEIVMEGRPLIGPEACSRFDWSSQLYLCFYLRGKDDTGLFGGHTPPSYISTFYSHELRWSDPMTVLYAVPVNISQTGYVPYHLQAASVTSAIPTADSSTVTIEVHRAAGVADEEMATVAASDGPLATPPAYNSSLLSVGSAESAAHRSAAGLSHVRSEATAADAAPTALSSATAILRYILEGSLAPDDEGEEEYLYYTDDVEAEDGMPLLSATRRGGVHRYPLTPASPRAAASPVGSAHAPPTTANMLDYIRYNEDTVSIFQRLSLFLTPMPYANGIFTAFAVFLERVCVVSLRYVRHPGDLMSRRHVRHTCQSVMEYLLSFGVELSLLKRAQRYVTSLATPAQKQQLWAALQQDRDSNMMDRDVFRPELHGVAGGEEDLAAWFEAQQFAFQQDIDACDAAFQERVVGWSRHFSTTHRFHLRRFIVEMHCFANKRFHRFQVMMTVMCRWHPALARVETVEELNQFVHQLSVAAQSRE